MRLVYLLDGIVLFAALQLSLFVGARMINAFEPLWGEHFAMLSVPPFTVLAVIGFGVVARAWVRKTGG